MYINLILGLAAVAAVFWLIGNYRRTKADPKELFEDDIARRRAAQEAARQVTAKLGELRRDRLVPVLEGLQRMHTALPAQDDSHGSFAWEDKGEHLVLTVAPPASAGRIPSEAGAASRPGAEEAVISWDLRDFDLSLSSGGAKFGSPSGEYSLRWPDGTVRRENEIQDFLRLISAYIAAKVIL